MAKDGFTDEQLESTDETNEGNKPIPILINRRRKKRFYNQTNTKQKQLKTHQNVKQSNASLEPTDSDECKPKEHLQ